MKHLSVFLAGFFTMILPALACDENLPPASALALQKQLVENLLEQLDGIRYESDKVRFKSEWWAKRSFQEVFKAQEEYYLALETQRVMEACGTKRNSTSNRRILEARIGIVSEYLTVLKEQERMVNDRSDVGEIMKFDVASARAATLKAEIRLAALKKTAGK